MNIIDFNFGNNIIIDLVIKLAITLGIPLIVVVIIGCILINFNVPDKVVGWILVILFLISVSYLLFLSGLSDV
ncbi:hypothetical protein ACWV26_06580 [Rummeliibacillus sp. JY-2-4R]